MHAAVLFLLAIQCLDGDAFRADARIEPTPAFALVKIAPPDLRGMKYRRAGNITIYSAEQIELFTTERRLLRLYVERGGRWWQLYEWDEPPVIEDTNHGPALPIVVEPIGERVAVTYTGRLIRRRAYGPIIKTVLLDVSGETPRVRLLVECTDASGTCAMSTQLACDARLRCTSTESHRLDRVTRTATRTFDLLTGQTFPPERFGAKTYVSGEAYAEAFAADRSVLAQRVVIDGIGPVTPVFELSRDSILFGGPVKDARVAVRFFHLTPGRWREIAVMRMIDAGATVDAPAPLGNDHTPDAPPLLFFAWNIEYDGRGRLIEVVAREERARSLYWIMFDPNGRTGAIRLAMDTPELPSCDDQLYPLSVVRLEMPEGRFPAAIGAIHAWRTSELQALPKRCGLAGRLGWSSSKGWQPTLFEEPCSEPWPQPYAAFLDDDGNVGVNFAPANGACVRCP